MRSEMARLLAVSTSLPAGSLRCGILSLSRVEKYCIKRLGWARLVVIVSARATAGNAKVRRRGHKKVRGWWRGCDRDLGGA